MAQQTINVGTAPNDGTGTPLRTAFQYTNSNFTELYTAVGPSGNNIVVPGSATITGNLTAAAVIPSGSTIPTNGVYLPTANNLGFAYNSTLGMTLNSSGLGVGVTPTAGRGAVQLSAGIGFPATQVASTDPNTLDDYEEGTWTGTLKGGVSDPTTPVTATGRYTKIGRQVFVAIHFNNVDTTGASGQITVTGAPFASNGSVGSPGAVMMSSIGTFSGTPVAFIGTGTTQIELYTSSSAGALAFVTHNAGTSRSLWTSLTYSV